MPPARPQLKAIVARTGASLATAVVAPAVLFCAAMRGLQRRHGADRRARLDDRRAVLATTHRAAGVRAARPGTGDHGRQDGLHARHREHLRLLRAAGRRRRGRRDRLRRVGVDRSTDRGPDRPGLLPGRLRARCAAEACAGSSDSSRCCGAWSSRSRGPSRCGCCCPCRRSTSCWSRAARSSPSRCSPQPPPSSLSAVVGRREGLLVG